jgi:hypothetical protein
VAFILAAAFGENAGGEGNRGEGAHAEECPSDSFTLFTIELVGAQKGEAGPSHHAGADEKSELGKRKRYGSHLRTIALDAGMS